MQPKFVNASGTTAADFALQASSPGVNQGADLSSVNGHDFSSASRPQGGSFDIGAFER
jgi:hypothetical protein